MVGRSDRRLGTAGKRCGSFAYCFARNEDAKGIRKGSGGDDLPGYMEYEMGKKKGTNDVVGSQRRQVDGTSQGCSWLRCLGHETQRDARIYKSQPFGQRRHALRSWPINCCVGGPRDGIAPSKKAAETTKLAVRRERTKMMKIQGT